jgi:DNA-binding NtrC family response regulator
MLIRAMQHRPVPRGLESLGSQSPAMQEMLRLARRVAAADTTVFLLGETGSGKERLAQAIHAESPRRERPFVAVNCAALPDALLESELFGHERGAFTGAHQGRRGHFELAHGGTLFLDEIAEMAPPLQGKLLRVLQEREIRRVGGEQTRPIDVRILAATSRDVAEEMARDAFRKDLYYRLAVVTLTVPPLRERLEDLPELAETIIETLAHRLRRPVLPLDDDALAVLAAYPWPGNVRELVNVLERALLLADGPVLTRADLPLDLASASTSAGENSPVLATENSDWLDRSLTDVLADTERRYLAAQLTVTGGRLNDTARRSGMDRRSLYAKLKKLGLEKEDFRRPALTPSRTP